MADWRANQPGVIGMQPITETSTTQKHPLGMEITAKDHDTSDLGQGTFVYLQGVASTAVASVVHYNQSGATFGTTALAAANGVGPVAVSMSANVASQFGWYQIVGKATAKVAASFADGGDCYLTSTAGTIDDANVAGDYIRNAIGASAIDTPSTGLAYIEINRPQTADAKDD